MPPICCWYCFIMIIWNSIDVQANAIYHFCKQSYLRLSTHWWRQLFKLIRFFSLNFLHTFHLAHHFYFFPKLFDGCNVNVQFHFNNYFKISKLQIFSRKKIITFLQHWIWIWWIVRKFVLNSPWKYWKSYYTWWFNVSKKKSI